MRWLFSFGYFGSWLIAAALLCFVLVGLFWTIADVSRRTGIDDDVTLMALPIGAVLGAWGAVRARHAAALHGVLAIGGVLLAALGTVIANRFLQSSEPARGLGPFAGLGELIAAGMSIVIVALGACLFGIWAFAKLARFSK